MRAVLVNHCHPDLPHVCAVRLREFARALAARGHRIVLLTETLTPDDAGTDAAGLAADLAAHDWAQPFRLACPPVAAPSTRALQLHRLRPPLSQAMVLWCYLVRGGVFWTWTAGSRPYWPVLAASFAPDVVWASFGNVDALDIARGLAAAARCPWVLDMKDPWNAFVPAPLCGLVARRYGNAAAVTALSEAHARAAAPWFGTDATVVYSGTEVRAPTPAPAAGDGTVRLVLTGSVYDGNDLATLMDALRDWLAGRDRAVADCVFIYAGGDHVRVLAAARALDGLCRLDIHPWLAPDRLDAVQGTATANLYIKGRTTPFHHKLMELLAAGRPVICHPAESAEARRIAGEVGVPLHSCADGAALRAALASLAPPAGTPPPIAVDREALARYTWGTQAATLERVLHRAARDRT